MAKVSLIGMSGSLRAGSFSNAILETLREKFADRADLKVYDLAPIPLYNQDFEGDKRPPVVRQMLADIEAADGLVLCAPEFNHSIPGVLRTRSIGRRGRRLNRCLPTSRWRSWRRRAGRWAARGAWST